MKHNIEEVVLKVAYGRNSTGKSDRHIRIYSDYTPQYRQNAEDRWGRHTVLGVFRTFRKAVDDVAKSLKFD
jgi:hypothetical protein